MGGYRMVSPGAEHFAKSAPWRCAALCGVALVLAAVTCITLRGHAADANLLSRGDRVTSASLRWNGKTMPITDRRTIGRIVRAARADLYDLEYSTRCLPDDHPEWWAFALTDARGRVIHVQLGVADDCGSVYVPERNVTYRDDGGLIRLALDLAGYPAGTEAYDAYGHSRATAAP